MDDQSIKLRSNINEEPQTIRAPEVARLIGVHPTTVHRWCDKGLGPKHLSLPGGKRLFRQKDVEDWLMDAESQGGSNGN